MADLCSNPGLHVGKKCLNPGICHVNGCINGPSAALVDIGKEEPPALPRAAECKPMRVGYGRYADWLNNAPDAEKYRIAMSLLDQMPKDLSPGVRLEMIDVLRHDSEEAFVRHKIQHGLAN